MRTAITKAKKGGLSQCAPEEMLGWTLKGVIAESKIDPKLIEDVAVGTVLAPGGGSTQARMGSLWAGIPNTAGCNSLNRQCSSGLAAVNQIANQIALGQIEIGIGKFIFSHYRFSRSARMLFFAVFSKGIFLQLALKLMC